MIPQIIAQKTKMHKKTNILFATDTNFVMPLAVCLTSLFENNKNRNIDVYVLHSQLVGEQENILISLAKSYGQNIYLILVDEHYFNNAPTFVWTKEAYYRLLINEYLPKELDRILYLDCDTIVNKPIDDLYDVDMDIDIDIDIDIDRKNYCLAAFRQKDKEKYNRSLTRLDQSDQLNPNGSYFNTGVIVFDLNKSRGLLNYEKALSVINSLGKNFFIIDETIINIIFDGKIKAIDQKYNNNRITNYNLNLLDRLLNKVNKEELNRTCIFHFTNKPWNNLYPGSCEEIWYKYLKISPYKDLYTDKYTKLKYRILRMSFVKFILHGYITFSPKINKLAVLLFSEKTHKKLKDFYMRNIR